MIQHARTPEIPGVVDGLLRIAPGARDSVSAHILIGPDDSGRFDHIEFVLAAEHAHALAQSILRGSPEDEATVPCRVGLQRHHQAEACEPLEAQRSHSGRVAVVRDAQC